MVFAYILEIVALSDLTYWRVTNMICAYAGSGIVSEQ